MKSLVLLLVLVNIATADPIRYRPLNFLPQTLAHNVVIGPGGTWTSPLMDVRYTENQSLYYNVTATGTPKLAIYMEGTLEGSVWADSTSNPTVTTVTAVESRVVTLMSAPVQQIRFRLKDLTGTVTTTVNLIGAGQ